MGLTSNLGMYSAVKKNDIFVANRILTQNIVRISRYTSDVNMRGLIALDSCLSIMGKLNTQQ